MPERDSSERRPPSRQAARRAARDPARRGGHRADARRRSAATSVGTRRSAWSSPSTATGGAARSSCRRSSRATASTSPAHRRPTRTGNERTLANAARRVPPDGGGDELQAAGPQDDGVLPRRPAQLRGGRDAEPARVRPGVLREAGRRGGRLQADRPPLQDAGLPAGRVPRRARGDPRRARRPPTPTPSPQTQEEFYFALPYREMDLCLWARDHGVPAAEVAPVLGPDARSRSSASSGTSRRSGASTPLPPPRAHCSIEAEACSRCAASPASSRSATGSRRRPSRTLARDGRARCATAGPDESGVYRDPRAGLGARAPVDHRPRHRASSRCPTRTASLWIVFNGEIFNYVELRERAASRSGHRFRTRSDTEVIVHAYEAVGRRCLRALQRPVRDRALGRDARDARPGARPARRPAAVPLRARREALVRQRGEGDLRRRPVDPAPPRPGRARRDLHVLDDRAAAGRLRGRDRARAGPRPDVCARAACATRVLAAALPVGRRGRVLGSLDEAAEARARGARGGGPAADAARRRAGRQLPLRRARQLARRRARAAGEGRPLQHVLDALRGRRVRRDAIPAAMASRIGSDHHEIVVAAPTSPRPSRTSSATPSGRCCARRRRRSSCCRGWCASRASRWC